MKGPACTPRHTSDYCMVFGAPPPRCKMKDFRLRAPRKRVSCGSAQRHKVNLTLGVPVHIGMTSPSSGTPQEFKKTKSCSCRKVSRSTMRSAHHSSSNMPRNWMTMRVPVCADDHHVACRDTMQQRAQLVQKSPTLLFLPCVRLSVPHPLIACNHIQRQPRSGTANMQ